LAHCSLLNPFTLTMLKGQILQHLIFYLLEWSCIPFGGTCNVELDYSVMAHAQKAIFVYGWKRRVHILLQQIWGVDSSARYWQLVSTLEWLKRALPTPLSRFPLTSPPSRRFVPSQSNLALTPVHSPAFFLYGEISRLIRWTRSFCLSAFTPFTSILLYLIGRLLSSAADTESSKSSSRRLRSERGGYCWQLLFVDVCLLVLTATGHKPNCT
jgi:hypothetical protein